MSRFGKNADGPETPQSRAISGVLVLVVAVLVFFWVPIVGIVLGAFGLYQLAVAAIAQGVSDGRNQKD